MGVGVRGRRWGGVGARVGRGWVGDAEQGGWGEGVGLGVGAE